MSADANRNKRRTEFLGVPVGTAQQQLRKKILFSLLQRHNEDVCFRCQSKIEKIDELSIEHKEPWEGRSVELFWDLNNIAFSHIRCNTPHRRSNGKEIYRPEGMNWCIPGQHFALVNEFYNNASEKTGLQNWCKNHRPAR